ncbi:MAG: rplW [Candidatus Saccharibacteria bacterium]|nr:rplW [Candidatus Saccharibacteria bacterium]
MNMLALLPRMSEKAYATSQALRTYVFEVPASANKLSVMAAVEKQFSVKTIKVTVITVKGKVKQTYRKGRRPVSGRRASVKKACVTLAEGQSIPIFAAVEEAEEKSEKAAEAVEKARVKAEKKEKK